MESFLERRVQSSLGMDPSCERSNLSFQNQRLGNGLSNRGKPIRREPDLVQPATPRCCIHIGFLDVGNEYLELIRKLKGPLRQLILDAVKAAHRAHPRSGL